MSPRFAEIALGPAAIVQVAKAAFPKGCPAMRMCDELGTIYDDGTFASAYPARGWPAYLPWCLALATGQYQVGRLGQVINERPTDLNGIRSTPLIVNRKTPR